MRDYLWWDVMTKSAYGDDLYEVREFRRRNPNWRHDTYTNPIIDDSDSVDLDHAAEALYSAMSAPDRDDLVDFS